MAETHSPSWLLARVRSIAGSIGDMVYRVLSSPKFFYAVVAIFAFQAAWIALSARFPQAFDENFHFGLIQLHAQQWLPFFTSHLPNSEVYGAVSRDPSYFYHYLMSLPYRILVHITSSQTAQVIVLRLINVAMFAWGLFVFRRLLEELAIGRRLQNVVFLFFVLTPVVPLLASQINYDNLIFPLTGLLFLYTVRYLKEINDQNQINVRLGIQVVVYGLLAGIVKYTSLPLFLAVVIILLIATIRLLMKSENRRQIMRWPRRAVLIGYAVPLIVFGGLFVERYGINMLRYHAPEPDCAAVLTVEQCQAYAPWARDDMLSQTLPHPSTWGIVVYPFVWIHRMVFETMFIISSRWNDQGLVDYITTPPLTVANYTAWVVVIAGGALAVYFIRRLWRMTYLRLLLLATVFYTAVLFIKNASMYLYSGEAVAIHGRYLVPVYPLLYLVLALSFVWFIKRLRRPAFRPWLVVIVLIPFLEGAGLIGWIFRSDPSWYWSQDSTAPVYYINRPIQNVVHRVVIP